MELRARPRRLGWITADFSSATLTLLPLAVGIDLLGDWVAGYALHLPLYLDSVGTVLVAALCGPLPAAATGAASDLIAGAILSPTNAPFAISSVAIGLVAGMLARWGVFSRTRPPLAQARFWAKVILAGALVGLVSATVSTPIAAYLFNGLTGGGTDILVALFEAHGLSILASTWLQSLAVDPYDKVITFVLVALVLKGLPGRLTGLFPGSQKLD